MASQISLPPEVLRRAKEAAAADAPAPAADASGMDAAEEQATRADFFEAVEYVNTQAVQLSDDAQRKLFGLHCVATNGAPPPNDSPSFRTLYENMPDAEREKDAAWRAAHDEHPTTLERHAGLCGRSRARGAGLPAHGAGGGRVGRPARQGQKRPERVRHQRVRRAAAAAGPRRLRGSQGRAASLKAFGDFDVNEIDDYHLTPLIHAVDAEREDSARLLLDAGADVNKSDDDGSTPLHYAALLGSMPLATLLADRGADRCCGRRREHGGRRRAIRGTCSSLAELLSTPPRVFFDVASTAWRGDTAAAPAMRE